ncbi:mannitol dehydrogenase family protein [Anaerococcus sp. AGMB00486]|uniref:Mannitol dehydrogenase family protein n=2 Tax=Anaerococcus TaxID=165779 RepID=A0ABX2NCH3_9FIRM|nr:MULTISPECIES: mannitol dehydrogenase family protein [Anaerococcus]MSS78420.1 mannitol dehydrogenase family protein [Anaerococcus porci]NVF12394.1 mannitol dehydrogenase family protein [Anaerococcus faecalis]
MKLNLENLSKIKEKVDKKPCFDVEKLVDDSIKDPKWLAFGSGNIFRGYIARIGQDMINAGEFDRGISVVETFDEEIIEKIYKPHDNLALSVTLHKDGKFDTNLIANLVESLTLKDKDRIEEIFLNDNLQIASFTITEKGYNLYAPNGELMDVVKADLENNPEDAKHLMSILTNLLYKRFKKNAKELTLLSLDNCSKNGDKVKDSVMLIANKWNEDGKVSDEFITYLNEKVSYPWTMIDKITPRPAKEVQEYVEGLGFSEMDTVVTGKNTYIAPFVNSEEAEYLVMEDDFKNGRPDFSKVGVYLADRETVNKVETMKVTTCLNPLHTVLATYGCVLGYESISAEMKDEELVSLIKKIGYDEALPVVVNPGILDPKEFIDEVINVRFPNRFIPDTPQRIATDTSQKVAIRFGETIKSYVNEEGKDPKDLKYIPLALAGWLRYLLGVNDDGEKFELSSDPLMDELQKDLEGIKLGEFKETEGLDNLLRNERIFGLNLEEVGLADKVKEYFKELSEKPGSVRETLKKYL